MKKKIKDLTQEEMRNICTFHIRRGISCLNEDICKCPFWYANSCLKGFIEKLQYIEKEVEVDE